MTIAAELAVARAKASEDEALIAQQQLQIAKLKHQVYGQRSERSARLIEQLALTFEELENGATEDELAAERAVGKTTTVRGFTRKRAERQTFPEHLPRERVVIEGPTACECCGSNRLRKLGEDVTRTLEVVPRQWTVTNIPFWFNEPPTLEHVKYLFEETLFARWLLNSLVIGVCVTAITLITAIPAG